MAKQTFTSGQVLTATQVNNLQANDYNWTVDTKTASYVLVAGDAGKRIVMNAAGATTITVNTSLFAAGDVVWIHNIGAGTCTVTAGTATVNTAGSLALAQWEGGSLYFTSASAAIFFRGAGASYGVATGGSTLATPPTGYSGLAFTATGTLTVTKAGLFDVLVCSGGGGGGTSSSVFSGAGGGAGGISQSTVYLAATTYSIQIGGGGAPGAAGGSSCLDSTARAFSVAGGGRGGHVDATFSVLYPAAGGSGGGGINVDTSRNTAAVSMAPSISGFAGGDGVAANSSGSGGGGGATAVGAAAVTTTGGAGGAGYDVSTFIGGSTLNKCAGGGGGGLTGGAGGSSGVGGAGGSNAAGTSAAANTASGGGGSGYGATRTGGSGGSGIVYIRWKV